MHAIYLAAAFPWRERVAAYAETLKARGFVITAEWLTQEETFTNKDGSTAVRAGIHEDCERLSVRDIANILDCDTLIMFETDGPVPRVTRVAEFGGALMAGKQCIVIGPEQGEYFSNIFVYLQNVPESLVALGIKPVIRYQTWEEFAADTRWNCF